MISYFVRILSNLKFAIFNLLSIGFFSIIGTLIEQEKSIEYYKSNYPSGDGIKWIFNWRFIQIFGIDQIYTNFWFNSLILILGLSLICCTITQQYPSLKFFSRCRLLYSATQFKKLNYKEKTRSKNFGNFLSKLQIQGYSIFQQNNFFYGYKGLVGRIAPIFVHISLILVLLGALQGTFQGFTAQELVPKTEIFHIQNLIKKGKLSQLNSLNMRVNDFWIQYDDNKTIKQFYSNISILNENGKELKRKTISVNTPLRYQDITIYQTDWTLLGLRIFSKNDEKSEKIMQLPIVKKNILGNDFWITWFKDKTNEFSILIDAIDGSNRIYDKKGELVKILNSSQFYSTESNNIFSIIDLIPCTGLQIKTDPGIPTLYLGFALLLISVFLSYLSFSQFWISNLGDISLIGGEANRSKIDIKKELESLNREFLKK